MSQIEGISVETLMLANKYTDEHGGGGGEATDAGSVSYDETKTYKEGTVGAELTAQSRHLNDLDTNKISKPASPASGAFLVWNGTAWVAQTLATWQGGNY